MAVIGGALEISGHFNSIYDRNQHGPRLFNT